MRFLENRMLAKKTGSGRPGDIGAMRDHHKFSFLVCLNHGLKKIQESGQFGTKPETGPNLSGKFFSRKNSKFIHTFDGMIEISLQGVSPLSVFYKSQNMQICAIIQELSLIHI